MHQAGPQRHHAGERLRAHKHCRWRAAPGSPAGAPARSEQQAAPRPRACALARCPTRFSHLCRSAAGSLSLDEPVSVPACCIGPGLPGRLCKGTHFCKSTHYPRPRPPARPASIHTPRSLHRYICNQSTAIRTELSCESNGSPGVAVDVGTQCISTAGDPCVRASGPLSQLTAPSQPANTLTCTAGLTIMTYCCGDKI
jgi:hypothetical protein